MNLQVFDMGENEFYIKLSESRKALVKITVCGDLNGHILDLKQCVQLIYDHMKEKDIPNDSQN